MLISSVQAFLLNHLTSQHTKRERMDRHRTRLFPESFTVETGMPETVGSLDGFSKTGSKHPRLRSSASLAYSSNTSIKTKNSFRERTKQKINKTLDSVKGRHSLTTSEISLSPQKVKVILLGDPGVGKTTFLQTFIKGRYSPTTSTSDVVNRNACKIFQREGVEVEVNIQDTGGQERFRSLTASYYRYAQGCLIFFDVDRETSFKNVTSWLDDLHTYGPDEPMVVILVGLIHRPLFRLPARPQQDDPAPPKPIYLTSSLNKHRNRSHHDSNDNIHSEHNHEHHTDTSPLEKINENSRHKSTSTTDIKSALLYEPPPDEKRQVPCKQAVHFAVSWGISYYEVDVRNDPYSAQVVMNSLIDHMLRKSMKSSLTWTHSIIPNSSYAGRRKATSKKKRICCYSC